jgi:hypothetical protein
MLAGLSRFRVTKKVITLCILSKIITTVQQQKQSKGSEHHYYFPQSLTLDAIFWHHIVKLVGT